MRTRLSVILGAACACLTWAASASAAVTHSTLTVVSPTGTYLIDDQVTPNRTINVTGTSDGTSGDRVDINCYTGSPTPATLTPVGGSPVNADGTFAFTGSLSSISKQTCVLRAVPHADTTPYPPGGNPPYTGPTLGIDEVLNIANTPGTSLKSYYLYASQLRGAFDYESLGACTIDDSFTYDPITFSSSRLDFCNAAIANANASASPTRSGLQVDGADAFLPGNVNPLGGHDFSGNPGFPSLTYSYSIDPATGNLVLNETDAVVKCNPGRAYPPTTSNCSSFVSTGVQVRMHITQYLSGRVATVVQYFSSTDGRPHTIDVLESNEFSHVNRDGELNFPWTGIGMQPYVAPGQVIAGPPPAGSGSFFVKGSASVPDGGEASPQGSVTFSNPPSSVTVSAPTTNTLSRLELHYARSVPAAGSVALGFTYANAFLASEVGGYAAIAQAAFRPSVAISSPAAGSRTSRATVKVSGTASDTTGLSAVTVDGRIVPMAGNGSWSTSVALAPGANTITAAAFNVFGNSAQSQTSVAFSPGSSAPSVSSVSQAHLTWREPGRPGRHLAPVGTSFGFSLSKAAQVSLAFTQQQPGRRVGRRCVAPTRRNRHKPRCSRTVTAATMTLAAGRGHHSILFRGLVHGRALKPGTYTLVIVASSGGLRSRPRRLSFTIVR